jgi:hypothetical protein
MDAPVCQASSSLPHEEKSAPVHSDFRCETSSLSLMGSAGRRRYRLHALEVPRPGRAVLTTV